MSSWTKEAPTTKGYYWARVNAGYQRMVWVNDDRVTDGEAWITTATAAKRGYEFGPAIPSAEAIELAKKALRRIDEMENSAMYNRDMDCDHPKECSFLVGCVNVNRNGGSQVQKEARAALAALESRP